MSQPAPQSIGRYRLESVLASGVWVEVHRARDTRRGGPVTLQRILPPLAEDPGFAERFPREVRIVSSLTHPAILPVRDFGEQDGGPYLVTSPVDGGSLVRRIGPRGLIPGLVVEWIAELADALDTAHRVGILHRDVRPGNVLAGGAERPQWVGFGLAPSWGEGAAPAGTELPPGAAAHLAPELWAGGRASPASDLYALAVLAYEMLCGSPPFPGDEPSSLPSPESRRDVPPLSMRVPAVGREVDRLFDGALASAPERRPADCRTLAHQLAIRLDRSGS